MPRKRLSVEEKERRAYEREVRKVFTNAGFIRVTNISGKKFEFDGREGEMDDVFLYENVLIVCEYTCAKTDKIGDHLLKKKILFEKILSKKNEFVSFLGERFSSFKEKRNSIYDDSHYQVFVLYCSRNTPKEAHKKQLASVHFLEYPALRYFFGLSSAIMRSSRHELFAFFGLSFSKVGSSVLHASCNTSTTFEGMILPEPNSKFEKGYKVLSFYLPPEALLERCYVLRRDGWRDIEGLYQRLIMKNKIKRMREYLSTNRRVFVNNIIVTLPSGTKIEDEKGNTVDPDRYSETRPVKIRIPNEFNNIGIIDGQHRIYAYHEGIDKYEGQIKDYRKQQSLLVTGVIYPTGITNKKRMRFEAQLFMEINANQSSAKSDLKQSIELILNPFSTTAIAKSIIQKLANSGPLSGHIEQYFFEKNKIKTTSIVSYGLKPLVKLSGNDSLFNLWNYTDKDNPLKIQKDDAVLGLYEKFCVGMINDFFVGIKKNLKPQQWQTDKKSGGLLTPTFINGFIRCLRLLVENKKTGSITSYEKRLKGIDSFDFGVYKSSQWNKMGEKLYEDYFPK